MFLNACIKVYGNTNTVFVYFRYAFNNTPSA